MIFIRQGKEKLATFTSADILKREPDLDTIVIPAQEEGFETVFMAQCLWITLRINAELKDRIRFIAVYRAAPVSAITHYASILSIQDLPNSERQLVKFSTPRAIGPLCYVPGGQVKPVQGRRYTKITKLRRAKTLDDAF